MDRASTSGRDRQVAAKHGANVFRQYVTLDVDTPGTYLEEGSMLSNPLFEGDSGQEQPVHLHIPRPRRLRWRLFWVLVAVLADIVITSYTTQLYTDSRVLQILAFAFQVASLATTLLSFYLLGRDTLFAKLMIYDRFVREFRPLFIVTALDWVVFLAQRITTLLSMFKHAQHMSLLAGSGLHVLYAIQRVVTVVYYAMLAAACRHALSDHLYSPACLDD